MRLPQPHSLGIFLRAAAQRCPPILQPGHTERGGQFRLVLVQVLAESFRVQPEFGGNRCRRESALFQPLDGGGVLLGREPEVAFRSGQGDVPRLSHLRAAAPFQDQLSVPCAQV